MERLEARATSCLRLSVLPGVGLAGVEPSHDSRIGRYWSVNLQLVAVVLLGVQRWGPSLANQDELLIEQDLEMCKVKFCITD